MACTPYDYLVIATGYVNDFDVIPGIGPGGNAYSITLWRAPSTPQNAGVHAPPHLQPEEAEAPASPGDGVCAVSRAEAGRALRRPDPEPVVVEVLDHRRAWRTCGGHSRGSLESARRESCSSAYAFHGLGREPVFGTRPRSPSANGVPVKRQVTTFLPMCDRDGNLESRSVPVSSP